MIKSVLVMASFVALSAISTAHADGSRFNQIDTAHSFYQALDLVPTVGGEDAKANQVGALLTPSARIELTDFDITQTKDEFLDSLPELDDALAGSRITHRIDVADGDLLDVLVCYIFASNSVLNREVLTFENGLISVVTQTPIADNCDAL